MKITIRVDGQEHAKLLNVMLCCGLLNRQHVRVEPFEHGVFLHIVDTPNNVIREAFANNGFMVWDALRGT